MEIQDFIAEIIHNPHDDVPRLIFADYLEEHGDPRAEMIRLSFELDAMSPFDKRRPKLRKRELQLLRKHGGFGSVPIGVKAIESHGGFIDGIEVTVARFLKLQDEIFASTPIRHVVLKNSSKFFSKLCDSPHLEKLGHLTLRSNDATSAELIQFLKQPALKNLRVLEMRGGSLDARVIEKVASATNLQTLNELRISFYGLSDRAGRAIAQSTTLTNLKSLVIPAVTDNVANSLANSPNMEHLLELGVSGSMTETGLQQLQSGTYCRNIERLSIYSFAHEGSGNAFQVNEGLPKLKHLEVGEQFHGKILDDIVRNYPNLETLDLTRNRITNRNVQVLAESPLLGKLDKLVLTANEITYDGVVALATSPHRNKRTKLYLRSNPVSRTNVRKIKEDYGRTFGNFGDVLWNHRYQ